jgi:hypothetical protein
MRVMLVILAALIVLLVQGVGGLVPVADLVWVLVVSVKSDDNDIRHSCDRCGSLLHLIHRHEPTPRGMWMPTKER